MRQFIGGVMLVVLLGGGCVGNVLHTPGCVVEGR